MHTFLIPFFMCICISTCLGTFEIRIMCILTGCKIGMDFICRNKFSDNNKKWPNYVPQICKIEMWLAKMAKMAKMANLHYYIVQINWMAILWCRKYYALANGKSVIRDFRAPCRCLFLLQSILPHHFMMRQWNIFMHFWCSSIFRRTCLNAHAMQCMRCHR